MKQTIVTGFSPEGYAQYGRRMLNTFDHHVPKRIDLRVYVHESIPLPETERRIDLINVSRIHELTSFVERHGRDPVACGRQESPRKPWSRNARALGYGFRHDAVKFSYMIMQTWHAATELPAMSCMAWLDGDTVFHANAPSDWIERTLRAPVEVNGRLDAGVHTLADVSYLGRYPKTHSECGWMGFRLTSRTLAFLQELAALYITDELFHLREWHSSYLFDVVRAKHQAERGLHARDLTPGGSGSVWRTSMLAAFSAHLKGPARKTIGEDVDV